MIKVLCILIGVVVSAQSALAGDFQHRKEIMENVINPCYEEVARRTPNRMTNIIGVNNMAEVFKMWNEHLTEFTINTLTKGINGSNLDSTARHQLYLNLKHSCINDNVSFYQMDSKLKKWPFYPFPKLSLPSFPK